MSIFIPTQVFMWLGAALFYGCAGGLIALYGLWCHHHPEATPAQVYGRAFGLTTVLVIVYDIAFHISGG